MAIDNPFTPPAPACYVERDDCCPWETFIPLILPYVTSPDPDIPKPKNNMIIAFMKKAAAEIMKESKAWTDTYCGMIQCDVKEYPIVLPEDRDLIEVLSVEVRGQDNPIYEEQGCVLYLDEAPTADVIDGYTVKYAYTYKLDDCFAPPEFCSTDTLYCQLLIAKVLQAFYGMLNMPWGNLNAADYQKDMIKEMMDTLTAESRPKTNKRVRLSPKIRSIFWDVK